MKELGRSPNGKAAERWLEGNHNGVVNETTWRAIHSRQAAHPFLHQLLHFWVQRLAVNPCTARRLKACVCAECFCVNRLAEWVVTARQRGFDHRLGFFLRVWCALFGGKARKLMSGSFKRVKRALENLLVDVRVTEPWSLGIHWVVKRTGLGKRELGGVADARILGNYQNFMNRLVTWDLPPGAVTEPWVEVVLSWGGGTRKGGDWGGASEWRRAEERVLPGDSDTNSDSWNSVRLAVLTVPPGGSYRFVGSRCLAPGGTCPPPGGLEAVAPSGTCPPLGDLAALWLGIGVKHVVFLELWLGIASVSYTHLDVYKRQHSYRPHSPTRATTQGVLVFIRHPEPQLTRCYSEPQLQEYHVLNPYPEPQLKGYVPSPNSRNSSNLTFEAVSYTHLDVYKRQHSYRPHSPTRATTQGVLVFIRHPEPQLTRCYSEPQLQEYHVLNPYPEPQLKGYVPSPNSRNSSNLTFEAVSYTHLDVYKRQHPICVCVAMIVYAIHGSRCW
ncbi:hypothetical protein DEO72_LG8g2204 [Vigna unguiculata]|uniref:Uncharacterized protein n=1 Tax=Vigna unguiculata TaxID=3917 RepID=A0A4D6MU81_VIGUN|nr:hypothetical protein DEO72_LG8g2204 [Vigna unguiculata]